MSLYTYIDLYEHGEKRKNIGFVKSEMRGGNWKLRVCIKNLPVTDTLMCEMKTLNNEEYVDRFPIREGVGEFVKEYHRGDLQERSIRCDEVQGLLFQLSSHKYGKCLWKNSKSQGVDKTKAQETSKEEKKELKIAVINSESEKIEESKEKKEDLSWDERIDERKQEEFSEIREESYTLPSYECNHIETDKWKQLGRMYTTVHPFHEKEKGEYISVKPKDFVILCKKYQSLVNNSFLLHGYFNYRHIILGKVTEDRKNKFYIGVPGTFHEREKKVAVMFGFEKFMGVKSEENGAFGYYMKEVEI